MNVLGVGEVTQVVKNRAQLTPRQYDRIGDGIVKALRGPYSSWPKKGEGVNKGKNVPAYRKASGASRVRFEHATDRRGNVVRISITNRSIGRDRNRALGLKGGGRKRYAKWPEMGRPNPLSARRAETTIRKRLPNILKRVLGPGWETTVTPARARQRARTVPSARRSRQLRQQQQRTSRGTQRTQQRRQQQRSRRRNRRRR